jgi:hypothetical protein
MWEPRRPTTTVYRSPQPVTGITSPFVYPFYCNGELRFFLINKLKYQLLGVVTTECFEIHYFRLITVTGKWICQYLYSNYLKTLSKIIRKRTYEFAWCRKLTFPLSSSAGYITSYLLLCARRITDKGNIVLL